MAGSPRPRSPTAISPARAPAVALLPGTTLRDPTYRRVIGGLSEALAARGWDCRGFCPSRDSLASLRRFHPGIAHVHCSGHLSPAAWRWIRACRSLGSALVVTFQDLDHPDLPVPTARSRRSMAGLLREAGRVTALTGPLARAVRSRFPGAGPKPLVIGNGVSPDWFSAGGKTRESPRIVALARLSPYKGVDILLWAFRSLAEKEPAARLTVFGRDFQGGRLQRLARLLGLGRRARFAGDAAVSRLRRSLSSARVFVSSSRAETYGMAVLEALAAGAPVLATRTGVARGLRHGRHAWLVPPGDPDALSAGLVRLWKDAVLRRRLSSAGPSFAARALWDLRARAYGKLYAELYNVRRRSYAPR